MTPFFRRIVSVSSLCTWAALLAGCPGDTVPSHPPYRSVSAEEFRRLSTQPGFRLANDPTPEEQARLNRARVVEEESVLGEFQRSHPMVAVLPPPAEGVRALPDGNYELGLRLASGGQATVVTMGPDWQRTIVANNLRIEPSRDNQQAVYEEYFNILPESVRSGLQTPLQMQRLDEVTFRSQILLFNRLLLNPSTLQAVVDASSDIVFRPGVHPCVNEPGSGVGSDRLGTGLTAGVCELRNRGLFSRHQWPTKEHLTCVKSQGNRGSCVAFATASTIEQQASRIARTNDERWPNLSEQALYNRATFTYFPRRFQDGLGSYGVLQSLLLDRTTGGGGWSVPFESAWNYNSSPLRTVSAENYLNSCDGYSETCSDSAHQSEMVCSDSSGVQICGFLPKSGLAPSRYFVGKSTAVWDPVNPNLSRAKMLIALASGNSVVWSFAVAASYDANDRGYVTFAAYEPNRGSHAVHLVGYVDNAQLRTLNSDAPERLGVAVGGAGGGYFIVKNSWSTCWGDGGYAYVPYDFVSINTHEATVLFGVQR